MIEFMNKKMRKNRKGFTLIELIVVIAILGILAAIAIPRFAGTMTTAKQRTHDANVRTIESAVGVYEAENGSLPDDIDALTASAKYLTENPDDPLTATVEPGYTYSPTNGVLPAKGDYTR